MLGHIEALLDIQSWILSLSLRLQLILLKVGTLISYQLRDVSFNTSLDGQLFLVDESLSCYIDDSYLELSR
jgi:hypothetical protein